MKAQSTAKPEQSRHQDSLDRGGQGQGQQAMAVLDSRPEIAQQQDLLSLMAGSPRLQRKCACGAPSAAGGSCAACEGKQNSAKPVVLQKKLVIGAADDPLEREADRVADQVMRMEHSAVNGAPVRIQRFTGQGGGQVDIAPASVERVLASSGSPLEPGLLKDMEQRFGHDFSRVRVHTGGAPEQSARDVNAHAYTVGDTIVFGPGRYAPETHQGRRLIAHELTHVLQQTGAGTRDGDPNVVHQEADRTLQREDAAPARAATVAPNTPRERLIRAIDRLDAIDLGSIPRVLSRADRDALSADKGLQKYIVDKLRLWPGLKLLVDLQYGPNLPADIRALVDAAAARDAAGVISAVQGSAKLRNQGLNPSVVATLIQVFAGDPRHDAVVAVVRMAAAPSLEEYLAFARNSPEIVVLEERARRARQNFMGAKQLDVVIGTDPGQTFTMKGDTRAQGTIVIAPNLTIQEFARHYAHELANVTILRELAEIKPGNFSDGYAYADAVLKLETGSMVEQAIVAAQLGVRGPQPTAADADKIKSGQMSKKQIYDKLYAALANATAVTRDGRKVPARDFYKIQWEANRRLAH